MSTNYEAQAYHLLVVQRTSNDACQWQDVIGLMAQCQTQADCNSVLYLWTACVSEL